VTPGPCDAALVAGEEDAAAARALGFATAVVVGDDLGQVDPGMPRVVRFSSRFGYFADGDIIGIDARSRRFRSLYRRNSEHNSFLVTERCNHYCLMCSQPPRDIDDSWILDEIAEAIPLLDPATASVGFTGGEPLLEWRRFIPLLAQTGQALPGTEIHVLTNGRGFADPAVASAWAALRNPRLCAGIPIYSSVDAIHDHVVQARGALDETVLGVLRLKDRGQRVEIRVVLHALTAPGLVDTCAWIARNLPFVDHVALMGLENTGFALANQDALWIDPIDYQGQLAEGVDILATARVRVSVYNLPLCVLNRSVWPFAVQSISDWKNAFPPACNDCAERSRCGGFFSSGRPRYSAHIRPFAAEVGSR
jgi:His-Xaa-Ser system radical SAM maturase HxsC